MRDEADFRAFVEANGATLLHAARLLTGDHHRGEDLLQTALTQTFLAWERIVDLGALDGYVRRTLVNTRTSQWRRRRLDEFSCADMPEPAGRGHAVGDPAEHQAQRDAVWRAVGRLPPRQRAMVVLRFYEDLTEAQTAEVMGVTIGTVKSAVSRALVRLRTDSELRRAG